MAQVESSVVNDVQDPPAHRDRPALHLSHTVQIGLTQDRQHLPRLRPSFFQETTKLGGVGSLGSKFGSAVPGRGPTTYHLGDPKVFSASDVGRQDS